MVFLVIQSKSLRSLLRIRYLTNMLSCKFSLLTKQDIWYDVFNRKISLFSPTGPLHLFSPMQRASMRWESWVISLWSATRSHSMAVPRYEWWKTCPIVQFYTILLVSPTETRLWSCLDPKLFMRWHETMIILCYHSDGRWGPPVVSTGAMSSTGARSTGLTRASLLSSHPTSLRQTPALWRR